jgi:hypothetical protein
MVRGVRSRSARNGCAGPPGASWWPTDPRSSPPIHCILGRGGWAKFEPTETESEWELGWEAAQGENVSRAVLPIKTQTGVAPDVTEIRS